MSWQPKIHNKDESAIVKTEREAVTVEALIAKGEKNVVEIGGERFVCPVCNEGWTFTPRINNIKCCGVTYVRG